jgi:hypothetical protein
MHGGHPGEPPAGAAPGGRAGDDVVDAEFKEVRDGN